MEMATRDPAAPSTTSPVWPTTTPMLTVLAGAVIVFVTLTLLVHANVTGGFDRAMVDLMSASQGSWLAQAATGFTTLGDALPLLTILVLAGVLVPVRWGGGWRLLMLPWVAAALAFVASSAIKHAVGRPRPPQVNWAGSAHGFAFPSGHATSATAAYLVLAVLMAELMPTARRRVAVLGSGIALALLVGASRIVLGVHWPTDVLAGWALGSAVAAATIAITSTTATAARHTAPTAGDPAR
jgi:undecaprenyl-diphosphatase